MTWDAVAGAAQYYIYRNGSKVGESEANNYKDTGLTGSTIYKYTVSAANVAGESTKSAELDLTTQPSTSGS